MSNEQPFVSLLRMIARSFYNDTTVVCVDYLLDKKKIEEHGMAEEMNLPA